MIKVATRLADKGDIPAASAILSDAEAETERWRGGNLLWQDRPSGKIPDLLAKCLDRDDMLCVIGTLDDVAVGIGLIARTQLANSDPISKIHILYVLKDARGVGIGEAMMAALSEWSQAKGSTGIDAAALPGDRNTKNFFESHGMSARALTLFKPVRE